MTKKVALIILDGWGIGTSNPSENAIVKAKTPFIDSLEKYPNCKLSTSGEDVGLPEGQMGNSEVGHLNIGAGRVVYQQLVLINKAFKEDKVYEHPVVRDSFDYAKAKGKKVHFIGLVSDGGVHSSLEHLFGLCSLAARNDLKDVYVHAFTDGRDTDPKSGIDFINDLEEHLNKTTGTIATVIGRYYAMDRDKRWDRTKKAYDLMLKNKGKHFSSAQEAITAHYNDGITDEFILPCVITKDGNPVGNIEEGDVVINFNFRTDRGRQITAALTQQEFPEQDMRPVKLDYITFTEYDSTFNQVKVMFQNQNLSNTLGEVYQNKGLSQLRVAETEKYPHVTFFFSGGREVPFDGEDRIMIPSPKVATYDLQPEMNAHEVTNSVLKALDEKTFDLLVLNFANADMVGHTGVFDAVVKAVETVDSCTEKLTNKCLEQDFVVLITADHGNADYMVNPDGSPNTAHTTNLVPFFMLNNGNANLNNGRLADIAPTILKIAGIDKPEEMDGNPLF